MLLMLWLPTFEQADLPERQGELDLDIGLNMSMLQARGPHSSYRPSASAVCVASRAAALAMVCQRTSCIFHLNHPRSTVVVFTILGPWFLLLQKLAATARPCARHFLLRRVICSIAGIPALHHKFLLADPAGRGQPLGGS